MTASVIANSQKHTCILGNEIKIGDSVVVLNSGLDITMRGHIIGFKKNYQSWSAKIDTMCPYEHKMITRSTVVHKVMVLPEEIVFRD